MIVKYNSLRNLDVPSFTLCNPGSTYNKGLLTKVIGGLVDHEAEEFVFNFNSTSELNLRVNRIQREDPEENAHVYNLYRAIQNRRLIFAEGIGYFSISSVEDGYDGNIHYKDIKAQSIDVELAQKMIPFIADGTYRFMAVNENMDKGILELILEAIPLWTVDHVDHSVAARWRTFEDVDTSLNCLSFLMKNVQEAYECIFEFDIIHRGIRIYDQSNYVRQTDIHITKDDIINSLNISENAEDLYTAINVFGGDENVRISAVHPLGTNTLYNFDYYLDWMSEGLREKVKAWQGDVLWYIDDYRKFMISYFQLKDQESNLEMEIERLTTQIKMYKRCHDNIVADSSTALVESYNSVIVENGGEPIEIGDEISQTLKSIKSLIVACEEQKESKSEKLKDVQNKIATANNQPQYISDSLSFEVYFEPSEYEELCNYIFEGSYTDEYVITTDAMTWEEKFNQMVILYDRAQGQMKKVSRPTQEFDIDAENFIFCEHFERWSQQLETGCLINTEIDTNDVASLFLSSIAVNYDDRKLRMTFGNRFNKFDPRSLFDDTLGNISKSANTLGYVKDTIYPIKNGELDYIKEALQTSRNLSMGDALSSSDEEIVVDASGYTGKSRLSDGSYDPKQVKLTNKNLVFTDDAWDTCKTTVGEISLGNGFSAYGVNAETIVGDVIIGNNVRIVDKDGSDILSIVNNEVALSITEISQKVAELERQGVSLSDSLSKIKTALDELDHISTSTGHTLDSGGLTIHKTDTEMCSQINDEGIQIKRSNEEVFSVNSNGAHAIDMTIERRLSIGSNCRIEEYTDNTGTKRVGCFFVEN